MSTTPILDLERDPPKARRNWVGLAIGVAFGMGLIFVPTLPFHLPAFNSLMWIPGLFVAIAIHEIGHLAVGKLVGMDPGGIAVAGILLFKSGDNWVVRFNPRFLLGGFAKPLPAKGEFHPAPYAWMIAGGPMASIVLSAVCAWAAFHASPAAAEWIGSLFWAALITVLSLIPGTSGILKSDGSLLLQLAGDPERSGAWIALLRIQTEEANGVLPRDWDAALVEQAFKSEPSWGEYPYRQLLAFYRKLDQRDESAHQHLENALAQSARSGVLVRHALFLEAACFTAKTAGNAATARTWLERARKLRKPESEDGPQAAIAMCERRYADALRHLAGSREFLVRKKLDSGLARFAKEKLAEAEAECHAALAASVC
jgi:hypothetical protein